MLLLKDQRSCFTVSALVHSLVWSFSSFYFSCQGISTPLFHPRLALCYKFYTMPLRIKRELFVFSCKCTPLNLEEDGMLTGSSFPLVCLVFAAVTIMTTSSRMIFAFARDGGLPASPFFARVHKKLDVPLNALYLTTILVIIFGLIFLGSSRYAHLFCLDLVFGF